MTLREKVRAAIEGGWQECTVEETWGVPPGSSRIVRKGRVFNADEAAERVMEVLALAVAAMKRAGYLGIEYHTMGKGEEFAQCSGCRASDWMACDIAHAPGCPYEELRDILQSFA